MDMLTEASVKYMDENLDEDIRNQMEDTWNDVAETIQDYQAGNLFVEKNNKRNNKDSL